jgi:transposase
VGEENLFDVAAHGEDGAAGWAQKGSAEQGNAGDFRIPQIAGGSAAGSDFDDVAGVSGAGPENSSEYRSALAGSETNRPATQKKSLHAAEQDSERLKAQRQLWREDARQIDPAQLIFLDESGVTTEMTRRYGRGWGGARLNEGVPAGHWRTLTVLGAVSISGWVATMTIEAPTDGDVFLAYLEHVLCPQLQPGQIVVMDNRGAHKVDGVTELIRQTGASLLYLPPYSPDFNPIEKCRDQIKQRLRALKARSLPSLQEALADALTALTPEHPAACFKHCGYGL